MNVMEPFSQLKKYLKNDYSSLCSIKIASLGDTSTQFLKRALRGIGFDYGFGLQFGMLISIKLSGKYLILIQSFMKST